MDLLNHLALGFGVALSPNNLIFCLIGALIGTLIGVLPGLGPLATMAILLPITFHLPAESSLIMLAGIYYGAQYGGSTTAILLNIPGESSSLVTCLDGHAMAQNGRAGAALAIAALASFFAGTVATLLIAVTGPLLALAAREFGAAEYFSLIVVGLVGSIVLAQGSVLRALAMVVLGIGLGLIGTDVDSGRYRYTFGIPELSDGIGFVPIAMGLLGITEIIRNLENHHAQGTIARIGSLMPNMAEIRKSIPAAIRGTGIGSVLGILPGGGALLSSFVAYTTEKKVSKTPEQFGRGAVEGVAGPEAANNAGAQTSFIPMLTLGIPSNVTMSVMIGALLIQGITPGPRVMIDQPALFWGIIASMWIGNAMLVVINLPLVGIWVKLLSVPYRLLFPSILVVCAIGVFSLDNSSFEIGVTALFVVLGYILYKLGCEPAPLVLGLVLGPMLEENFRRAMQLSRGDFSIFVTSPISLGLLVAAALLLISTILPMINNKRNEAFQE